VSTKIVLTGSVFEADEGLGESPLRAFSPYGLSKTVTGQIFPFLVRSARRAASEICDSQSLWAIRRTAFHALFDVDMGKRRHRGCQDAGLRARQHSRQSAGARLRRLSSRDANRPSKNSDLPDTWNRRERLHYASRARWSPGCSYHAGSISRHKPIFRNRSPGSMQIVRMLWRLVGTSRPRGTNLLPTTKAFSGLSRRNRQRAWSGSNVS
jgi:hypothetical protein